MELKYNFRLFIANLIDTFNRTAYGIEIVTSDMLSASVCLLIAPLMELKLPCHRLLLFL